MTRSGRDLFVLHVDNDTTILPNLVQKNILSGI